MNYFWFVFKTIKMPAAWANTTRFFINRMMGRKIPEAYRHLIVTEDFQSYPDKTAVTHPFKLSGAGGSKSYDKWAGHIDLASRSLPLELKDLWTREFDDIEDLFSLHRFGWLLILPGAQGVLDHTKTALNQIIRWIELNFENRDSKGWDSYSISERVVNWVYFLLLINDTGVIRSADFRKICISLRNQLTFLAKHLEFRFSGTNNHLLNNGRALYLAGTYLQHGPAISLGREIITTCSRKMFSKSGFLNEGSSHYQSLMARTFLEIYLCARNVNDIQFADTIEPAVKNIIRAALYFTGNNGYPFIGDVSPDFRPEFHAGWGQWVVKSGDSEIDDRPKGASKAWQALFHEDQIKVIQGILPKSDESSEAIVAFPDAGHYKFRKGEFTLLIYANPMGYVPEWSHGHADIGSFILFWKKIPVFVDTGRYNFQKTAMGLYGRSVRSHNSISIEGYEPCVVHGLNGYAQLLVSDYLKRVPEISWEAHDDILTIRVALNGFRRIWPDIGVYRVFKIGKEIFEIKDHFTGSSQRSVETFFHLHPDIGTDEYQKNSDLLMLPDGSGFSFSASGDSAEKVSHYRGHDGPRPAGWFFPGYGQKTAASTLVFSGIARFPSTNRFVLKKVKK